MVGDYALSREIAERFQQRLLDTLALFHEQHNDQMGVGRARLRRMALPVEPESLVFALINHLLANQQIVNSRGWLHLPQHGLTLSDAQQVLWERTQPLIQDAPWWVRDLAKEVNAEENEMRQLLRQAALLGYITAVVKDRYYRTERMHQFADLIRAMDATQGSTSAADFRDRLGVGRNWRSKFWSF